MTMMKHAHDVTHDRRAMAGLIVASILFACLLGLILDRVLELAA